MFPYRFIRISNTYININSIVSITLYKTKRIAEITKVIGNTKQTTIYVLDNTGFTELREILSHNTKNK